jgi:FG-GAP repeat
MKRTPRPGDLFGGAVAIRGDTFPFAQHTTRARPTCSSGPGWAGTHTEAAGLTASNGHAGDSFGESVAIDGRAATVDLLLF